jgi:hypothetical protein
MQRNEITEARIVRKEEKNDRQVSQLAAASDGKQPLTVKYPTSGRQKSALSSASP